MLLPIQVHSSALNGRPERMFSPLLSFIFILPAHQWMSTRGNNKERIKIQNHQYVQLLQLTHVLHSLKLGDKTLIAIAEDK